ncbi:MAG: hypothetical protein JNM75_09280 [Rhodospirillales bacterium]|nr:hypothetical protein [Rhodospirillales bacterium]
MSLPIMIGLVGLAPSEGADGRDINRYMAAAAGNVNAGPVASPNLAAAVVRRAA